jgi:hypothetical protein
MSVIANLADHRPFPDLSIAEFALLVALLRAGPHPAAFLIPTLDAWFDTKLRAIDLEPTIARLIRANLILRRGTTLYPKRHARTLVIAVYGNLFRILGEDMAKLISAREPSLLGMLRAYLDRRARDDREKHHQKKDED